VHVTKSFLIVALCGTAAIANAARAQTVFRRETRIPVTLSGGEERHIPPTVMQQQCEYEVTGARRVFRKQDVVQRLVTVNSRLTVMVTDTLTERDTGSVPLSVVGAKRPVDPARRPLLGEVYVESGSPSVLRVRATGGDSATLVLADPVPDARAKRCNLTFDVRNGIDLGFASHAWVLNAIAIPVRVRPGFSANDAHVNSEVSTSLGAGVSLTYTRWGTWYAYREGVSSAVRTTNKMGVGPFVAFSTGTADKSSTKTDPQPLVDPEKASFVSVLPGLSFTISKFGIDLGIVGGIEHVLGSRAAQKWDWNNRPWYGINLGFGFAKWGA
jgi:hypothetical protein